MVVIAVFCALLLGASVPAQCQLEWLPGTALGGPSGRVTALANLPNGDLMVAGWFEEAGPVLANRVARYDGSQWQALGGGPGAPGLNDAVLDMVVAPNGDVYVAGAFTEAAGIPVNHVARWDGTSWSALGEGLDRTVRCLELLPNGNLLAGGGFQASGSTSVRLLAEWDGSSWSPVGSGLTGLTVYSIAAMPGGGFAVGGSITGAGGAAAPGYAIWDGANWSTIPSFQPLFVNSVACSPNGDLAIAGVIGVAPSSWIAVWDGTTVQTISSTGTGPGSAWVQYAANGDLLAVTSSGNANSAVWRWNGAVWSSLGGELATAVGALLERPSGELLGGGGRSEELVADARALQVFDGSDWRDLFARPGFASLATDANGDVLAASSDGRLSASAVSRWNGSQWTSLGSVVSGAAFSVVPLRNGNAAATGVFPQASGAGDDFVLRWDGLQWNSLTANLIEAPLLMAESPDATLFASFSTLGPATVAAYDGNTWSEVGTGLTGFVFDMGFLPNGDLIVVGDLQRNGGAPESCLRWDGGSWSAFGPALADPVQIVRTGPDGSVFVATGTILQFGRVFVGDGSSWTQLGGLFGSGVSDLELLPNGDLLACSRFDQVGSVPAAGMARWNGSAWSEVDMGGNRWIGEIAVDRRGEIHVAGLFTRLGSQLSAGMGRARTNCPADVAAYGQGCTGPAGPVVLAARDQPWIGATYRVRAYGMPSSSLALHAVGLGAVSVALPPLLPQSLPGCQLLTSGEILEVSMPAGPIAEPRLQLPNDASLVGRTFYQQVVAVQIGVGGSGLLTVSSSNGLAATIGSL